MDRANHVVMSYDDARQVVNVAVHVEYFETFSRHAAPVGRVNPLEAVDALRHDIGEAFLFMGYEAAMWRALEGSAS